jgi:hypothetical protein
MMNRYNVSLGVLAVIYLIVLVLAMPGCTTIPDWVPLPKPQPEEPVVPALPVNPDTPPDPAQGRGERWDLNHQDYDGSIRVRWPTELTRIHGAAIGPGSYTMVGPHRAEWRSWDTDNESNRSSYTMPASSEIQFPVLCILHTREGKPVAWFSTDRLNTNGRLLK